MRKRAKTVQTPLALDERQRTRQGIAWILKAAEKGRKGGVDREVRIAREVLGLLDGNSDVFKWLEERHKVATANRWVHFNQMIRALLKTGRICPTRVDREACRETTRIPARVDLLHHRMHV